MTTSNLVQVSDLCQKLQTLGIDFWLDGGWGVDALLGHQSRDHQDLDLIIQQKDHDLVKNYLLENGFKTVQRDDLSEIKYHMVNEQGFEVDLTVIEFDVDGRGIFGPVEDNENIPAGAFVGRGIIDGLEVKCIAPDFIVEFHQGYELQAKDVLDIKNICQKFGFELPDNCTSYLGTQKPKLFFITGVSGCGKTTIGRKLTELGEVALDSKIQPGFFGFSDQDGKAPAEYLPNNKEWAAKYKWTMNRPMFESLMKENEGRERVFLCGGADDLIKYWPLGKKVFILKVGGKTLLERLNRADRDNDFGKDPETQQVLLERLERKQNRLMAAGATPIDAERPAHEVAKDILGLSGN